MEDVNLSGAFATYYTVQIFTWLWLFFCNWHNKILGAMDISFVEFRKLNEELQQSLSLCDIHTRHFSKDGLIYVCKQVYYFYVVFITDGNNYFAMKSHRNTNLPDPFLDTGSD